MRRLASRSLLLAAVLSGGCASTRPQPPASAKAPTAAEVSAYINAPDACALILGGGFSFENPQAMEGWLKVSGVVLDAAHLELTRLGYRVEKAVILGSSEERLKAVAIELVNRHCSRIIEITPFVKSDAPVKQFGFQASVLAIPSSTASKVPGATTFKTVGEFSKTYTYDLTSEVMQNLSMGEVGRTIARDIDQSGVVTNRRAEAPPKGS